MKASLKYILKGIDTISKDGLTMPDLRVWNISLKELIPHRVRLHIKQCSGLKYILKGIDTTVQRRIISQINTVWNISLKELIRCNSESFINYPPYLLTYVHFLNFFLIFWNYVKKLYRNHEKPYLASAIWRYSCENRRRLLCNLTLEAAL